MAKVDDAWIVREHGPLEQLEDNLWRAEGGVPGFPLRRVMTVARLTTGELVVHNPIVLEDAEQAKLEALGPVAYLVVPNGVHRLDAPAYAKRYPEARVLAPPGSLKKVIAAVARAVDFAELPADRGVALSTMAGTRDAEAVMVVRSGPRSSLVLTDALFNMPHLPGVKGFVLKRITGSSGGPRVSRLARWFLIKDKAAFADHLEQLATPELARVIVSHHETITERPGEVLREVAATLR